MALLRPGPDHIATAVLGAVSHQSLFKHGEWHMEAPLLFSLYICGALATPIIEALFRSGRWMNGALIVASFSTGLFSSMAIYRLFFHRARHFPGPKLAAVSKLYHVYQCRKGQNHLFLKQLHERYGTFVRTGPGEITVFHPDVLALLDGPGNKCSKSVWYDFLLPRVGVTTIRDRSFHDQRRRVWNKAVSTPELKIYEQEILKLSSKLDNILERAAMGNEVVSVSDLMYWFSFDIMGFFALSRSFNMLDREEWHYSIKTLRRAMRLLGPMSPVPWLAQIGFKFLHGYWVIKDWEEMVEWCRCRMHERIQESGEFHDIARWIIGDSRKRNAIDKEEGLLTGDAIVAIIAGSDTVAPTMVFLFYQLALNKDKAEKLYRELEGVEHTDIEALRSLPYLNAVIKETLRYHPAVPSGGYRDTSSEGMMVGDTFIPPNTTIVAPRYILNRLESCYARPNEWLPERWDTQPELVRNSKSFLPFAQGRYRCLGQDIATAEMLVVTASIVGKFHVEMASGTDISRVERDMKDQFTATPGQLDLLFRKR